MDYLHVAIGLAVLLFGRSLFWLLVGLAGFLLGAQLVPLSFPDLPAWAALVAGTVAGLVGALFTILAERVAFGIAGFFAGALLALYTAKALGIVGAEPAIALGGGLAGAVVAVLLTDWAIIVLASLVGARVIVIAVGLSGPLGLGVYAALVVIGLVVQHALLRRTLPERTRR